MGEAEPALADYDEAYTRWAQDAWILEGAIAIAAENEQYDRALGYYDRLLRDQGGDPRYLVGRGYVQRLMGDYEAARASAERALELDESLIGAHYLLGLVLLDVGNAEDAIAEFELIYNVDPEEIDDYWLGSFPFYNWEWGHDLRYDLARAHYEAGDIERALAYLDELIGEDPGVFAFHV
jgi:tetratricopeptide (TPR) repeat protein